MNVSTTDIPGVLLLEPKVFTDERGFFMETFRAEELRAAGIAQPFVQENQSQSRRGVLRGLHYQLPHAQGKLVRVVRGEVFDVAVDLRRGSPTFGRWLGVTLSESNRRQFYIPPGLAHGFCATSDVADLIYKCTDYYHPECEKTLLWNDPHLAIQWPVDQPVISEKDRGGQPFAAIPYFD